MKKIFLATLAIAALTACNKEEVIKVNPGEVIAFGDTFVDNATKAAADPSYSTNDISSFKVYGTVNGGNGAAVIYSGTEITKGGADYGAAWICPVNQYWIAGAAYKFIGVVDGDKNGVSATTLTDDGMPTTISYTADGVTDLLCQTVTRTGLASGNEIVSFSFNHLLAKAKFTVNNNSTTATNYLHKVRDIKISNAYNTATYNISAGSWGSQASNGGQGFDDITASDASTECANEKLLIPGLPAVTVEFVIDLYYIEDTTETLISTKEYTGTNAKTATVLIEAGKAYDFNISVEVGELIQFSVTQQPSWTPNDDTNIEYE